MNAFYRNSQSSKPSYFLFQIVCALLLSSCEIISSAQQYSITYNSDGGSEVAVTRYKEGAYAYEPTSPTRDGFIFDHWFFDGTFRTEVEWPIEMVQDYFLYAKWAENSSEEISSGSALHAIPHASFQDKNPIVLESYSDGEFNFYLLDVGFIEKMYISTVLFGYFNGVTPISLSRTNTTESSITNAFTNTLEASISATDTSGNSFGIGVGTGGVSPVSVQLSAEWSRSWTSSETTTRSVETSLATVQSETDSVTISLTIGDYGEAAGYYRYALYALCDIYFVAKTTRNNQELVILEPFVCARDNTFLPHFDFSEDGVFDNSPTEGEIVFSQDFYKYLTPPEVPIIPEKPFISNAKYVQTNFFAYFWTEGQNQGRVDFTVTGIKASYNGKYYVYGTAHYLGNTGGTRFNDVDDMYLKDSSQLILLGGTLHWRGSSNDNNESGVAGWNKLGGSNLNTVRYFPEDPKKDYAGNESNVISITDICVSLEEQTVDVGVPEIISTSFTSDLFCESSKVGFLTFEAIGLKVQYEGQFYVYGNAFHSGNANGKRFNDVENLSLKNASAKILLGGTLHWYGSKNDNNESGVAGFDKKAGFDAPYISYFVEDPYKDFAGNESVEVSITGVCVKTGNVENVDEITPEMVLTSFETDIYAEASFCGNALFDVVGIKVEFGEKAYVYGNAFYYGKPGGARFDDVSTITFKNVTKAALNSGTLAWQNTPNDNNVSGIAGPDCINEYHEIVYLIEDPGKDLNLSVNSKISITSICVEL